MYSDAETAYKILKNCEILRAPGVAVQTVEKKVEGE